MYDLRHFLAASGTQRNAMTALTASHRQKVIERLRARLKLAVAYMQAAIEAGDQVALLLALRAAKPAAELQIFGRSV